jgi:hypothetical protein
VAYAVAVSFLGLTEFPWLQTRRGRLHGQSDVVLRTQWRTAQASRDLAILFNEELPCDKHEQLSLADCTTTADAEAPRTEHEIPTLLPQNLASVMVVVWLYQGRPLHLL